MPYIYEYPRPLVTVDIIVISRLQSTVQILLIKRKNEPYADFWALPGGFVDINESLIDAAHRELFEETNVNNIYLRQFYTFGDKGRDPRGHNISTVFYGFIDTPEKARAGDDAAALQWFDINGLPSLAFDHKYIIEKFCAEYL